MTMNKLAIARGTLWAALAFNLVLFVVDVWQHNYVGAAVETLIVAVQASWIALAPRADALLEARLGAAIAEREASKLILAEVQRLARAGELRFTVKASTAAMRTH